MSDSSKTAPPGRRYDREMHGEHLLLLGRPQKPAPRPRFERSRAPFVIEIATVRPELARYVESICVVAGKAAAGSRPPALDVLPGMVTTLCVSYGERVERDGAFAPSAVCGVFMRTRSYVPQPAIGVVMVAFRPGGLKHFIRAPADELTELAVAAEDIFGRDLRLLEDEVASASSTDERAELVQRWLLARLEPAGRDPLAVRIAGLIATANGAISVAAVSAETGLSDRQLERRFAAAIGIAPKRFARLARFSHALALAQSGLPWAEIAASAGYADQSHLNREFVALVGAAPDTFARRASVMSKTSKM